jgi:hypothetical protein
LNFDGVIGEAYFLVFEGSQEFTLEKHTKSLSHMAFRGDSATDQGSAGIKLLPSFHRTFPGLA